MNMLLTFNRCILQAVEDRSTADALAALQAEVRCIKHTRATQQGDPLWGMDGDGGGARIARLEGQLAQMEVTDSDFLTEPGRLLLM